MDDCVAHPSSSIVGQESLQIKSTHPCCIEPKNDEFNGVSSIYWFSIHLLVRYQQSSLSRQFVCEYSDLGMDVSLDCRSRR